MTGHGRLDQAVTYDAGLKLFQADPKRGVRHLLLTTKNPTSLFAGHPDGFIALSMRHVLHSGGWGAWFQGPDAPDFRHRGTLVPDPTCGEMTSARNGLRPTRGPMGVAP